MVLINKPGANGAITVVEVARAKSDGYTFGWGNLPTLVIHSQLRKLPNDPNEFVYVASPNSFDYMVLISKDVPWKTWENFIQYNKDFSRMSTYGIPGRGSNSYLTMEFVAMKEGIEWQSVPFPGNSESIAAVIGDYIDVCITDTASSVSVV